MRWLRTLIMGGLSAVIFSALGLSCLVFPYLRDDRALDWIVRVVALDWRDFGHEAALTRLKYEIDHQQVGQYVTDDACQLSREAQELKVRCEWAVQVAIPLVSWTLPLSFSSRTSVDASGTLH